MKEYTFQEKINIIKNSTSLGELPLEVMPFTQSNEYYFVSYSHADYKEVYADILRLQAQGINIWYDRGLPAGRDWEKTAYEAIIKYSCIGVIFYLSKNSLLSNAVASEINFVKENGKDYMSINLPLDGEKCLSASAMLENLAKDVMIDKERIEAVNSTFDDKVIYLDYNAPAEFKADKIKLMKRADLLTFEVIEARPKTFNENGYRKYETLENVGRDFRNSETYARLIRVNDIDITEISIPKMVEIDGQKLLVREIGECAFANCQYLQKVEFPTLSSIKLNEKAFYGCKSLKKLDLGSVDTVCEFAFGNCTALEEIAIVGTIHNNAFWGCKNLKRVYAYPSLQKVGYGNLISGQIQEFDVNDSLDFNFQNGIFSYYSSFGWSNNAIVICGNAINGEITPHKYITEIADGAFLEYDDLQVVNFYSPLSRIGEKAFYKCKNLKEVNFLKIEKLYTAESLVFENSAFAYCTSINKVIIPKQTQRIGKMAFLCCINLSEVIFEEDSNLKIIDRQAFDRCLAIKRITLPDSLESIGINAFAECKDLEEIVLSSNSNLQEIHAEAFVFCEKLCKITLPVSLKSISKRAFFGCNSLKIIFYRGSVEQFKNIDIVDEEEGKRIFSRLDTSTPAGNIRVLCLDGEINLEKNDDIPTRISDITTKKRKK